MPFGIAKLNSIGRYVAAGAPPSAIEDVFTSTNLEYTANQYQIPKVSYVGDDSSGQPVFFCGLDTPTGWKCSLFRRNNNGTLSESAALTLKTTDELFSIQSASGLDTVGNPVGVVVGTYRVGGSNIQTSTYATQINVDALTLGTAYNLDAWDDDTPSSDAGFAYVTYSGINGRFICGYRQQGVRAELQQVSPTTITGAVLYNIAAIGGGVYQDIEAFPSSAGSIRYAFAGSNNVAHGLGYYNSSEIWQGQDTDSVLAAGIRRVQSWPINADTYIAFTSLNIQAEAVAGTVTWPTSGGLSQTVGSAYTMNEAATWNNAFAGAVNPVTETLYILGRTGADVWGIFPLTASGTVVSEGTKITTSISTSTWSNTNEGPAATFANSAQGDLFTAIVDDTSSNKVFIYFKEIA